MGVTLDQIETRAAAERLTVAGGFHPVLEDGLGEGTLLLLAPAEPGFWAHLTASPEGRDGAPDPVDRWSRRVIGRLACDLGAKAKFPFAGPPWHPFYQWALRSGLAWASPVTLLVGARMGLFASYRGALLLREQIDLPKPTAQPCASCAKPCLTACPAGALGAAGYDVPRCHAFLDTPAGADCLTGGCRVRRACPVSQSYGRRPEQSAYHMSQFHR
ncbi:ferredoxin [Frigidibacter sp. MR17.14]|uniref:ferredoxin n=1 Tax=Frigidibacter sp. MR17.14 TaxID=3126509 RepID=UPI003012F582